MVYELTIRMDQSEYFHSLTTPNNKSINKAKLGSLLFGVFYSSIFTFLIFIIISQFYGIQFNLSEYLLSFLFLIPLLLQMILINQIYKYNLQNILISSVLFIITIQLIFGYLLIYENGIIGALILKAGSQWLITLLLWFYFKKKNSNNHS